MPTDRACSRNLGYLDAQSCSVYVTMKLPDLDFSKIRPCRNTRHGGFEELSVSLFRSEDGNRFDVQRVEGSGGDGGVEAFVGLPNQNVVGLQSKYFGELKTKQWKQVEASIERAIESHPTLERYIVAVPLDRTPAALERWSTIQEKWKPKIELVWWGHSELLHLLSEAKHHGRLRYWFGVPEFDAAWLARQNSTAINDLDTRYTPARHVRTEAENLLDAVAGAASFVRNYFRHVRALTKAAKDLVCKFDDDLSAEIAGQQLS